MNEGLGHANKCIRDVAAHVIQELSADPYLRENALPSHLERLQQRIEQQSWAKSSTVVRGSSESELSKNDSELSQTDSVRNHVHLRSDSELIQY